MSAEMLRNAASSIRNDVPSLAKDALWHPAVALAVAAWLEEVAEHLEVEEGPGVDLCLTAREGLECSVIGQALVVARLLLGEDA